MTHEYPVYLATKRGVPGRLVYPPLYYGYIWVYFFYERRPHVVVRRTGGWVILDIFALHREPSYRRSGWVILDIFALHRESSYRRGGVGGEPGDVRPSAAGPSAAGTYVGVRDVRRSPGRTSAAGPGRTSVGVGKKFRGLPLCPTVGVVVMCVGVPGSLSPGGHP